MSTLLKTARIALCAGLLATAFSHTALAAPNTKSKTVAPPMHGQPGWQDDFVARAIVRAALLDLRLRPAPLPDDYRLTARLLEIAQTVNPADIDIPRRLVEAGHNARDAAVVERATRRVVELDPTDTVAQLRLIAARMGRLQTAEERLNAYAGFLGEKAAGLDGSIRSRLALDAALLARELGDDSMFIDHLKTALRLDSTNKEAALVALGHFSQRIDDPAGRVQLLSNLLLADPLDPQVNRQICGELARGGAYVQARRFHQLANGLFAMSGVQVDEHFAVEGWICTWAIEGSQGLLQQFEKLLITEKYKAAQEEEQAKRELREARVSPDDIRLSASVERIRLLAADSVGDQKALEAARASLTFVSDTFAELHAELVKNRVGDKSQEETDFRKGASVGLGEIQLLRLWTNVDVDRVEAGVAAAQQLLDGAQAPPVFKAVSAWRLLRDGRLDEALAAFELLKDVEFEILSDRSIAELEPVRIGRAMTLELLGRPSEAAEIYKVIAVERALDASGMWCKLRLERMGGNDPERERLAARLAAIGDAVPRLVEEMVKDPSTAITVSADVPVTLASAFDRSDLVIKIRNKTRIPLGLGTDRAINSRFLAQPAVDIHTRSQMASVQPEVLDLDRRMRLQPGETLEVRVRADAGYTGWLIESGAAEVVRSRFRIMQGFVPGPQGAMVAGPGCVAADAPQVVRNPLKQALMPVTEMTEKWQLAAGDEALALLQGMRARVMFDENLNGPARAALAAAIAARYPLLDVRTRMAALAQTPNAAMYEEFKVFDDIAKQEAAPGAAALAIVSRITDAADPALDAFLASTDEVTKEVAGLQRARLLELDAGTLSRRGFRAANDTGGPIRDTPGSPPPSPLTPPAATPAPDSANPVTPTPPAK